LANDTVYRNRPATRDYAIQYLDSMEGFSNELARADESLAEAIKEKLDGKKKKD